MYLSVEYFRVVVYVNVRPCLCRQNLMYVYVKQNVLSVQICLRPCYTTPFVCYDLSR
jgi:hypothetical protein